MSKTIGNGLSRPSSTRENYVNPFVPEDLRHYPGMWQQLLPDYYGAIKAVDDSVGVLLKTLADQHLLDSTIVVMLSDHANHFLTRTYEEWKCTPHDSSIHIPLLIQGPGFDYGHMVPEVVSMVDIAPALLDAAGVPVPPSMQGRSFMPVLRSEEGRRAWRGEAFIQFAASAIGRALRTDRWTYAVVDPNRAAWRLPPANYQDFMLYDLAADPHQLLNLSGRHELRTVQGELRERLNSRIAEAGEMKATIKEPPYGLYS